MNEPIFLVWCKDKNEWEKDDVFLGEDGSQYHTKKLSFVKPDNHIVLLWTTISDANKTKIFDQDIVMEQDGKWGNVYGVVKMIDGCWMVDYGSLGKYTLHSRLAYGVKTVGSRFINPQLMEKIRGFV